MHFRHSLGPLFHVELLRLGRKPRTFILRFIYALLLLLVLVIVFSTFFDRLPLWRLLSPTLELPQQDVTALTERFVVWLLVAQGLALILLTPAAVAGTIAEERERRTLELLFTTHLTDWEILLGKLGSRLVLLLTIWLAGLPLLALMQFFGGVSLPLILLSFSGTAVWVAFIAMISLAASVQQRSAGMAMAQAYFVALSLSVLVSCVLFPIIAAGPPEDLWVALVVTLLIGVVPMTWGTAIVQNARRQLRSVTDTTREPADWQHTMKRAEQQPVPELRLNLPPRPARPKVAAPPPASEGALGYVPHWRPLPRIGRDPIVWKERYLGVGMPPQNLIGSEAPLALIFVIAIVAYALPVVPWVVIDFLTRLDSSPSPALHGIAKILTLACVFATLATILWSAARCIVLEHEQKTLMGLLILPYRLEELLWMKLKGVLLRHLVVVRLLIILLALPVLLLLFHPASAAAYLALFLAQTAFVLCLGLFISCWARTVGMANFLALAVAVIVLVAGLVFSWEPPRAFVTTGDRLAVTLIYCLFNPLGAGWWTLQPWSAWLDEPRGGYGWFVGEQLMPLVAAALYALGAWVLFRASEQAIRRRYLR